MSLSLDLLIFGNGKGLAAPTSDQPFYFLGGRLYHWIGGLGAQLGSFEWVMPAPGTEREIAGRTFRLRNHRSVGMTPMTLTPAQRRALEWLPANGIDGALLAWRRVRARQAGKTRAPIVTQFRLRRADPDSAVSPDRYSVILDGLVVGAILADAVAVDAPPWAWSITALVRKGAEATGREATREDAMAAFRAAWERAGVDMEAWRKHLAEVERAEAAYRAIRGG